MNLFVPICWNEVQSPYWITVTLFKRITSWITTLQVTRFTRFPPVPCSCGIYRSNAFIAKDKWGMTKVQCFCCKEFGHLANNCKKRKMCNHWHGISECWKRPQNWQANAYQANQPLHLHFPALVIPTSHFRNGAGYCPKFKCLSFYHHGIPR